MHPRYNLILNLRKALLILTIQLVATLDTLTKKDSLLLQGQSFLILPMTLLLNTYDTLELRDIFPLRKESLKFIRIRKEWDRGAELLRMICCDRRETINLISAGLYENTSIN